jgi:hypothetical protein
LVKIFLSLNRFLDPSGKLPANHLKHYPRNKKGIQILFLKKSGSEKLQKITESGSETLPKAG